jgi:hypothetical protein
MATVEKGWLKSRTGNYFSPMILDEAIQTADGKFYKEKLLYFEEEESITLYLDKEE